MTKTGKTIITNEQATVEVGDTIEECKVHWRKLDEAGQSTIECLFQLLLLAYALSIRAKKKPIHRIILERLAELNITVREDTTLNAKAVKVVFPAKLAKQHSFYATAIDYGKRMGWSADDFASELKEAKGGISGLVRLERAAKRDEEGAPVDDNEAIGIKYLTEAGPVGTAVLTEEYEAENEDGLVLAIIKADGTTDCEIIELLPARQADLTRLCRAIGEREKKARATRKKQVSDMAASGSSTKNQRQQQQLA